MFVYRLNINSSVLPPNFVRAALGLDFDSLTLPGKREAQSALSVSNRMSDCQLLPPLNSAILIFTLFFKTLY